MNPFQAVLFDFDGTLADTSPGILHSIRYAMEAEGLPIDPDADLNYFLGPPLYHSFTHIFGVSAEMANTLTDQYRVYYNEKGVFECTLYPGIKDLLQDLRTAGIKVAVVSSKPSHFLHMVLPYLGIDSLFDAVVGPDLENKKANKAWLVTEALRQLELPAGPEIAMLGDRQYDMVGAVDAGVTAVGVTYGYGSCQELQSTGAQHLVDNVSALRKLLLPDAE